MKAARVLGIVFLVLGAPATYFGYTMLRDEGSVIKILMAGPALVLLGLSMLVLPGGNVSIQDINQKTKSLWADSPWSHKAVWLLAGLAGIGVSFTAFVSDVFF